MTATKNVIQEWLQMGKQSGCTHVLVVCDTFNHEDYPIFVTDGNPRELAKAKDLEPFSENENMQRLMEVYNLAIDIDKQLGLPTVFNW